jgi:hypothetical protein
MIKVGWGVGVEVPTCSPLAVDCDEVPHGLSMFKRVEWECVYSTVKGRQRNLKMGGMLAVSCTTIYFLKNPHMTTTV